MGGFKKQLQGQSSGLEGLGGLLGKLGGGNLLDDVVAPQPTPLNRGNEILGQIFGSKEVSRTVAQNAASQTGISPDLLKKMLPMVAMLITGYMAKHGGAGTPASSAPQGPTSASDGGLGGLLGGLLGGGQSAGRASGSGLGRLGGLGGLASMLDADGDGNPLDDILRKVGSTKF
jgi:hypothetical protein